MKGLRFFASLCGLFLADSLGADPLKPRAYFRLLEPVPHSENHFHCSTVFRFELLVDHEQANFCSLFLGLTIHGDRGQALRPDTIAFTYDDIWSDYGETVSPPEPGKRRDYRDFTGVSLQVSGCHAPIEQQPPSTGTPIGILELVMSTDFDGSFALAWDDPVLMRGYQPQPPALSFGGSVALDIFLEDSPVITLHCPALLRGDPNDDAKVDVSDAVAILEGLFSNGDPIRCLDAADVNDDGTVDISDPVYLLEYLFLGTRSGLPPPFPDFGPDTTDDALACEGAHPAAA